MGDISRRVMMALPGFIVLALNITISIVTGHPADLFHTNSTMGVLTRTIFVAMILICAIPLAPRLISLAASLTGEGTPIGRLVKTNPPREHRLSKFSTWVMRPLQGIGLTLLAGESLIELLESTAGLSYSLQLARLSLFVLGSAVMSLILSTVWTLDDLGVWLYSKLGEVSTAGSTVGTILPIASGAVGIATLFHYNTPLDAVGSLIGLMAVMYPPFLFFAIAHDEYTTSRLQRLHASLPLKTLSAQLL